jgi:NADPH:quinone reductase
MTLLLAEGRLVPHPYEVQPNGLLALEQGLQALCDRKVSSKKLVYRIADTPHLENYE